AVLDEAPAEIAADAAGAQHEDFHVFFAPRRGSTPRAMRRMFSRCRQITSSAIAPTTGVTGASPNKNQAKYTANNAAITEASDTRGKNATMMAKVASAPTPSNQ